MRIYNGWGEVIFQTNDMANSWDGRVKGKPVPVGSYAYALRYLDRSGEYLTNRGVITLVR